MKLFFKTYKHLTDREKSRIVLTFILRIIVVVLDLAGIALIGVVVSLVSGTVISPTSTLGIALAFLRGMGQEQGYVIFAVLAVAFFTVKSLVSIGLTKLTAEFISKVETQRAVELFENLMGAKTEKINKIRHTEISSSAHQGIHAAFSEILTAGAVIVGEVSLLIAVSAFLIYTNVWVFILLAAFFGLVGVAMNKGIGLRAAKSSDRFHEAELIGQAQIFEFLSNFRQIATSPRRRNFITAFAESRNEFSKEKARYSVITSLPRHLTEISIMFGIGILVFQRTGSSLLVLDSPTIAIFVAGIFRIVASMVPLQNALSSISANSPSANLALQMLNLLRPAAIENELVIESEQFRSRSTPQKIQAQICLKDVSFQFPNQARPVLQQVNLDINRGEFIAITGRSGAGKSTLADLLSGLSEPTNGQVIVGGLRANANDPAFRQLLSYVPQQTTLIAGSLCKNIAFDEDVSLVDQKKLRRAIRVANLEAVVRRLPEGLDTHLGAGNQNLSGGEIQRIGIARAIYNDPKVIVIDEGTSALDSETQSAISNALLKFKGKTTLIVIAHRKSTLNQADRQLRVSGGRLTQVATKVRGAGK